MKEYSKTYFGRVLRATIGFWDSQGYAWGSTIRARIGPSRDESLRTPMRLRSTIRTLVCCAAATRAPTLAPTLAPTSAPTPAQSRVRQFVTISPVSGQLLCMDTLGGAPNDPNGSALTAVSCTRIPPSSSSISTQLFQWVGSSILHVASGNCVNAWGYFPTTPGSTIGTYSCGPTDRLASSTSESNDLWIYSSPGFTAPGTTPSSGAAVGAFKLGANYNIPNICATVSPSGFVQIAQSCTSASAWWFGMSDSVGQFATLVPTGSSPLDSTPAAPSILVRDAGTEVGTYSYLCICVCSRSAARGRVSSQT
jgi:hypothetical protein